MHSGSGNWRQVGLCGFRVTMGRIELPVAGTDAQKLVSMRGGWTRRSSDILTEWPVVN